MATDPLTEAVARAICWGHWFRSDREWCSLCDEKARAAIAVVAGALPNDPRAVEAGSWAETLYLGRIGTEASRAVLRAACDAVREDIRDA